MQAKPKAASFRNVRNGKVLRVFFKRDKQRTVEDSND